MTKLQRYTKGELMKILRILDYATFNKMVASIPGLGEPMIGGKYSKLQVKMIFENQGEPYHE
jgi:hypothetical protein